MAYDMWGQREMSQAVLQLAPVGNFFLRTFFNGPVEEHNSDVVDFDIYKGKKVVAPYSRAGAKSTPLARQPFTTQALQLPYIKLNRSLEAAMQMLRLPGENIYSNKSPLQRAQEQTVKDLKELNDAISRAEELQAAQAIIYGKITIKGFNIDAEIDLRRDAANTEVVDAADAWTEETADIHAWLRAKALSMYKLSGITPNILIAGANVLNALFANEQAMALLDNRRTNVGGLTTTGSSSPYPAARSYGDFAGFDLWEYYDTYVDMWDTTDGPDGTEKPLIPDNSIILASTGMQCVRHYGAIKDFGAMVPMRRFAKTVVEQDPSTRTLILQSAPAMINHTPDATALIQVVNIP